MTLPTYYEFGVDLITTYDLDPIYPMVVAADLDDSTLKKWLLAYWCYYDAGVASRIAESKDFYMAMKQGVAEGWPRGMERRYFYSKQAMNCINGLIEAGKPEEIVDFMTQYDDFQSLSDAVISFTGFGPWMAWKIGDMAERVLQIDVDFSNSELGIYKDPLQGAAYIKCGDKNYPISLDELHGVCETMEDDFSLYLAPPFLDRPINIQEVETVLCKYKAHCFGHYPYGNDTIHIAKALERQEDDLSEHMYDCLLSFTTYLEDN